MYCVSFYLLVLFFVILPVYDPVRNGLSTVPYCTGNVKKHWDLHMIKEVDSLLGFVQDCETRYHRNLAEREAERKKTYIKTRQETTI